MNYDFAPDKYRKARPDAQKETPERAFRQQRKLKTRHKRNTFKESGIAI
jgi:hypothetical protein